MQADLEWWANSQLMIGPFPVAVEDERTVRLRDPAGLEDLRSMHTLDPFFTLRFADDSTIEVIAGRPDDDGRFELTAIGGEEKRGENSGKNSGENGGEIGTGEFAETEDVARTAAWLIEHGFVNSESTTGGSGFGSRLFVRDDGWEVRYHCVLGTWTLELKPPRRAWVSFARVRTRTGEPRWRQEIPELIATLTPSWARPPERPRPSEREI